MRIATTASVTLAVLARSACAQSPVFVDRGAELGIAPAGEHAAWGDVDADGWPDLWAGGVLWMNHAGKSFTRIDAPGAGVIADIDNDGTGDLVSFAPIAITRCVREGEGDAATIRCVPFAGLPELPATTSRGAAVGDFNGDGFLDIATGGFENWETQTTFPSFILLNEKGQAFKLAWSSAERRARGVSACDFDRDGDLDIYFSNYRLQPNTLLVNDGTGKFADEAAARNALATSEGFPGGHSIGACFGDFDNDGCIDLFAGNFAHVDSRGDQPKSRFLRNRGAAGGFAFDDMHECGVFYQESYASPACGDYDNDGRLDLFFTTVYADASFGKKNFPVLYRSDAIAREAWSFKDATAGSGLENLPPTYQAAWADFNHDGRLDLVTAGRLFVHSAAGAGHWLEVRLRGDGARVNRDAIGAEVRVFAGDELLATRQVEAGTGEGNANSPLLHFGLGAHGGPLRLEIRWSKDLVRSVDVPEVDCVVSAVLEAGR